MQESTLTLVFIMWTSQKSLLKGKTVLITGASSGFGRYLAGECAKRGAKVIMASRSLNNLELARSELQTKLGIDRFNQFPASKLVS